MREPDLPPPRRIPLAIELAAARGAALGLQEIEDGLAQGFALSSEGYRTAPPRQQTLAAAIGWSYDLLDEEEKRLLRILRPLPAAFPARAAEVTGADTTDDEPRVRATLERLVERCLVQVDPPARTTTYTILPTIRDFVFRETGPVGFHTESRGFVLTIAQHTAPALRGPLPRLWSALFDGPTDVARQALDLVYDNHDLEAGSFLAGVVAARKSATGRVGFVGGVRSDYIGRFEAGFRAGTAHADPEVALVVEYLGEPPDFTGYMDSGGGRRASLDLYRDGVDVVYHAAGLQGGSGVLDGARHWHEISGNAVWVIGVDLDERVSREPEQRPYVLTSMRRQIPTDVYLELKAAVAAGHPERAPMFDLANGGVGLATTGGEIDDLADELEMVRLEIIAGDIALPAVPPRASGAIV